MSHYEDKASKRTDTKKPAAADGRRFASKSEGMAAVQLKDSRPDANRQRRLQKTMENSERAKATFQLFRRTPAAQGVVQLAWGDDHTPADVLRLLTGKGLSEFKNHRGEPFTQLSKSESASGDALVLSIPGSTTHLTIPYTKKVDESKYEGRGDPHMTGLFNSGTAEAPEMTEWSQVHDLSGVATENAAPRTRDDQRYVRRPSLAEGEFLMASKVTATGERRSNARGEGGARFIRRPSVHALELDEGSLPLSAEEQADEDRYQAFADELGSERS